MVMIADYVLSFLLNRLQFAVRNVHVYFQVCVYGCQAYGALLSFDLSLSSDSRFVLGGGPITLQAYVNCHAC